MTTNTIKPEEPEEKEEETKFSNSGDNPPTNTFKPKAKGKRKMNR